MTKILHKIRLYINLCIQNSNNKVKIIDSKQCAGLNEKILCYCEEHGDIYSSIFRIKRAIFICPECNDKYYHDHQLQIKKSYHDFNKEEEHAKWGIKSKNNREYLNHKNNERRAVQKYEKDYNERVLLTSAKKRAKKDNYEFSLVRDDINIPERCPILDIHIVFGNNCISNDSPTIDKLVISKGVLTVI